MNSGLFKCAIEKPDTRMHRISLNMESLMPSCRISPKT